MRDSAGHELSAELAAFIAWAEVWTAAQLDAGEAFASVRARFNAASPILVDMLNAMTAARAAQAQLDTVARAQLDTVARR